MSVWTTLVDFILRQGIRISVPLPPSSSGYTNSDMNDLRVIRKTFTDKSTIGDLYLGDDLFCVTLERSCRDTGEEPLAIPAGRYEITLYDSPHFQRKLPLLNGVLGREYIEIHPANFPEQLKGCIAVGMRKDVDVIYDSRRAFDLLFAEIEKRLQLGKLYIEISEIGRAHV